MLDSVLLSYGRFLALGILAIVAKEFRQKFYSVSAFGYMFGVGHKKPGDARSLFLLIFLIAFCES